MIFIELADNFDLCCVLVTITSISNSNPPMFHVSHHA